MRLCELLFSCFSQALPAHVPAGTKGTVCQVGFGGKDPRTGDLLLLLRNDWGRVRRPKLIRWT